MELRYPGFLRKALTLSYDDGVESDIRLVDIMEKYGLRGTFNLNSELFGMDGKHRRLTEHEVLSLYPASGNEAAVHGARHLDYRWGDDAMVIRDVAVDREKLEQLFGSIIRGMAYPYGAVDDRIAALCGKCGIVYSRSTVSTHGFALPKDWLQLPATCHHADPMLMELGERFLGDNEKLQGVSKRYPILFYLWGHSYEFDDNDNWNVIEDFGKLMGGHKDIWYATNMEIYSYVHAFKSLVLSMNGKTVFNPTVTDVYVSADGKELVLPAGKTTVL